MTNMPVNLATWRGLTRRCGTCGQSVLSFDMAGGTVLRLRVSAKTMRELAEVCSDELARQRSDLCCPECAVHSDNSSGRPICDVSSKGDGENVALLARSSKAEAGE